ncbi:MAG: hypothetical protein KatS3mg060_2498 [Dehalococcoidia bacterium]|nr:MAG: hypothetical protein KatS3mg060_2498 [Dehalococcoidia bacterium]
MMDEAALRAIHRRLLDGDPTASLDLVEQASEEIARVLGSKYTVDPTWIADAVTDALFDVIRRPESFRSDLGSLSHYLIMSAEGDLKNRIQRERKHLSVVSLEAVEDDASEGKTPLADQIADPDVDPDRWVEEMDPTLTKTVLEELPDECDRKMLQLMMERERRTSAYADVLGIPHLSAEEQRRIVKQHKDRIRVRLQRALKRQGWRDGS